MKKVFKRILYIILLVISFDFIPVKFCINDKGIDYVFVSKPKMGDTEWGKFPYINGQLYNDYENYEAYIVRGNNPNNVLSKRDFDWITIDVKDYEPNMFVIYFDNKAIAHNSISAPTYEITSKKWDIIYPVNRISFRRYYVPKNYLTIYDYNWLEIIKNIFE